MDFGLSSLFHPFKQLQSRGGLPEGETNTTDTINNVYYN